MSDSADQMKASASEAADSMKEGAGEMKDSAEQYVDDATITANVKGELVAEPTTKAYQISVETLNGTVQLSGFVQSAEEKSKAGEIAKAVPGVKSVKNDLILKSKTQGLDDSRKIKTA
jgi:osmotically-inducible protein OsmY